MGYLLSILSRPRVVIGSPTPKSGKFFSRHLPAKGAGNHQNQCIIPALHHYIAAARPHAVVIRRAQAFAFLIFRHPNPPSPRSIGQKAIREHGRKVRISTRSIIA
jgi:hypothetical protein